MASIDRGEALRRTMFLDVTGSETTYGPATAQAPLDLALRRRPRAATEIAHDLSRRLIERRPRQRAWHHLDREFDRRRRWLVAGVMSMAAGEHISVSSQSHTENRISLTNTRS